MKVIPRAGVTEVAGTREGRLLIRLAAAPVDGAANGALVAFLSEILRVPRKQITVSSGAHSRNKTVMVAGVTRARVERYFASCNTSVSTSTCTFAVQG